jgi:hypothetical protein
MLPEERFCTTKTHLGHQMNRTRAREGPSSSVHSAEVQG